MASSTNASRSLNDARDIAQAAKAAFQTSQLVSSAERVKALHEIRKELEASKVAILAANTKDLEVRRDIHRDIADLRSQGRACEQFWKALYVQHSSQQHS